MTGAAAGDGAPLLTAHDLLIERAGTRLLDVPHVEVREGEVLSILGPNGAGKSTLLRVLAMLQKPDRGTVRFRDFDGAAADRLLRRESAFVFQKPHLWAGTVRENIQLGLRLRREPAGSARHQARQAAVQLGIEHLLDRDARSLSGGEAQRVAIARAMVLEPQVLFLDEPAANLDLMAQTALMEDLEHVARVGSHATV
ncbi:MAG: ATP-binding cassette domain-containing protein, partial [Gemmatimonadetes bacterium]|nr:ATP-binding cassette domain-containing protein [Gemmatimonadota bacterium]